MRTERNLGALADPLAVGGLAPAAFWLLAQAPKSSDIVSRARPVTILLVDNVVHLLAIPYPIGF